LIDASQTSPQSPLCSIVIPTWQRASALKETLESLSIQSSRNFEVIVVCDGEDAPLRQLSREWHFDFPVTWVFHSENRGQAAARNSGVEAARGDVVLFLDDDTPADPQLVEQHLKNFVGTHSRLAVYGTIQEARRAPLATWTDKFMQQSWERSLESIRARVSGTGGSSIGDDYERSVSVALNCSIRRDEFLRSGGFNPKLRQQDEEMEFGLRLHRSGVLFRVEPLAIVHHRNVKPMGDYFRRAWYLGGQTDTMRVFEFEERSPQTRQLAGMHHGSLILRWINRSFYFGATCWHKFIALVERATNRTGSRLLFGAWARIARRAEYWRGAKEAGATPDRIKQIVGNPGCALMFHSLAKPQSPEERTYYLSPQRFRRYLRWMQALGYGFASPVDWMEGRYERKKILLTFDDGYDDLYEELLPTSIALRIRPLVFLIANREHTTNVWDHARGLRKRNLLTIQQIREMQGQGVVFGSHTMTHPWLTQVSDEQLRREVADSKHALEDLLGAEVHSFAYPYGGVDQRVRAAVAEAGYKIAFTTMPGLNWWNDPLTLRRGDIHEGTSFLDFFVNLRSGHSVLTSLVTRAQSLESDLPTPVLRSTIRLMRSAVRPLFPKRRDAAPPPHP
jgi:peptidoglycan/xylan/chitin deacetylase (PgdA/CDA1 family)/GT2 family glycosyltransferase